MNRNLKFVHAPYIQHENAESVCIPCVSPTIKKNVSKIIYPANFGPANKLLHTEVNKISASLLKMILPSKFRLKITKIHLTNVLGGILRDFYIRVTFNYNASAFDPTTFPLCLHQSAPLGEGETMEFTYSQTRFGRYVVIHFPPTTQQHLTLCEVEVYSDIGRLLMARKKCARLFVI